MSKRRKPHHHEDDAHANHERWLLTYADMITLLMVLFIVLFAISQVDQKKFATLAQGLAQAFGGTNKVLDGQNGLLDGASSAADQTQRDAAIPAQLAAPTGTLTVEHQRLEAAKRQMMEALRAKGLEKSVQFSFDERGLIVRIVTDHVLFPTGSATLATPGREVLHAIGPTLHRLPNDLVVEGHTDNVPVTGRYPSNWELSTMRATTVLRYLLATASIDPHRMSAAGYADTRGLVPNDSPAHRALNRRVQIVVLARKSLTSASTSGKKVAPNLASPIGPGTHSVVTPFGG